jgi:class 3 adenylate cyclase
LQIRAGVHTGEVELRGDDEAGLGVVIASRICDLAAGDQVLVSRTVKDLVAGSGITLEDGGTFQLKGVPEEWQLFFVA